MPIAADTNDVRRLLDAGAQLVDVLPAATFAQEHLPKAINIPLAEIAGAPDRLDRDRPVVVYCYDYQCDLSPRAAARLETLGFTEVYDYVASKTAWLGEGLESDGLVDDGRRAGAVARPDVPCVDLGATLADVARAIGDWDVVVVTNRERIVLGVVRREAVAVDAPDLPVERVMQPAPPTVRPSIPIRELAGSMADDGEERVLVTTLGGRLIGLVRRDDLAAH